MENYTVIAQELVGPEDEHRFLGCRTRCRYCGTTGPRAFGKTTNAHTFPRSLGNRSLFSLDECKKCNTEKFSCYEDALAMAIGPYLSLGGVEGRNGVRKTGTTRSKSSIRHSVENGHRRISIVSNCPSGGHPMIDPITKRLTLRFPIEGDRYKPRYAYKALLKIAISLLPESELINFSDTTACLGTLDAVPHPFPMKLGFSHAYIGNAPPVLAGTLLRRTDDNLQIPYMLFIFVAGSVCFQIWLHSDNLDCHVPEIDKLDCRWISQFLEQDGSYLPIRYSESLQFDWTGLNPIFQPFEAFELEFDPRTTEGIFTPIRRT